MVTALTVSPRLQKIYAWSFMGLVSGWNFATSQVPGLQTVSDSTYCPKLSPLSWGSSHLPAGPRAGSSS